MNIHVPKTDVQGMFDEAVKSRDRLTAHERTALFMKIFVEPPVVYFAPGADKIGIVPMRAHVYMRNSKGDYERSTSMLRQFAPIQEFAASRLFNIMGIHCDPDTSGRSLVDLPGLMNLVILCRRAMVDVIIVEDADRLSRSGFLNLLFDLIEQHDIVIWDLYLNRQLTREVVALKSLLATTEVKKIGKRVNRGREINAAQRDKITKGLADGHKRLYLKGPVAINVERVPLIIEASTLFDTGVKPGQIIRRFNKLFTGGNKKFQPPGQSKLWHIGHLLTYNDFQSGYLEN